MEIVLRRHERPSFEAEDVHRHGKVGTGNPASYFFRCTTLLFRVASDSILNESSLQDYRHAVERMGVVRFPRPILKSQQENREKALPLEAVHPNSALGAAVFDSPEPTDT